MFDGDVWLAGAGAVAVSAGGGNQAFANPSRELMPPIIGRVTAGL